MTNWFAQSVVWLAAFYVALGLLFALWFVTRGLARVDESARDAGWGLRILLIPGSAALWPFMLRRILRKQ